MFDDAGAAMGEKIRDFFDYIRFNICIFSVFIASSGYLLYAQPSIDLLFVALSSFFVCVGAYSYNNIVDKKEDSINRGRINPFSSNFEGVIITASAFLAGFVFSLFLSPLSVLFYIVTFTISLAYSGFRLKKYLLVKNLYTGFGITQVFLIGASNFSITSGVIHNYILISAFITIGSIISDLRDYKGDKAANIMTLPVFLGYEKARRLVMLSLIFYSVWVIGFSEFFVIGPFVLLMLFAVFKDNPAVAHLFGRYSFVLIALWLVFGGA